MEVKSLIQLVLGYLAIRIRSRKELCDYLETKTSDPQLIEAVVAYLELHRLIDDEQFAQSWAESRLRKHKGDVAIHHELRQKGVAEAAIRSAIDHIEADTWITSIAETVAKYQKKLAGFEGYQRRAKIYGILSSRGFSSSRIDAFLRSRVE